MHVGGGFGVKGSRKPLKIGTYLKVVFHDIDPKTLERKPNAPVEASFVVGNSTNQSSSLGAFKSDVPGGLFVTYPFDPTYRIMIDQVSKGVVTLAVARKQGGVALPITIETDVEEVVDGKRKRSPKTALEFLDCTRGYLQDYLKDLPN